MQLIPLIGLIVFVVAIAITLIRASARTAYHQALSELQRDPLNPVKRTAALETGRKYSCLTRNMNGVALFDEAAINNDINAACQGTWNVQSTAASGGVPFADRIPECDVWLLDAGMQKLNVIKVIRDMTGFDLRVSKDITDVAPSMVVQGVSRRFGQSMLAELTVAGARAEIRLHEKPSAPESDIATRLKTLDDLLASCLISQEEYDAKRRAILESI